MQTRCQAHVAGGVPFAWDVRSTLTECFNYCSDTPGCKRQVDLLTSLSQFWELADSGPSQRHLARRTSDLAVPSLH